MRFGIFVDAACDLPAEVLSDPRIQLLPIPIMAGSRLFVDARDPAVTRKFYRRALSRGTRVTSWQPFGESEIEHVFLSRLIYMFDDVTCLIHAGSRSPIYQRVQAASSPILDKCRALREEVGVEQPFAVRAFDSQSVYAGQGVQVLELARMVRAEAPPARIVPRLEEIVAATYTYVVPDDLAYINARAARKGDRGMGIVNRAVGSALDLKPVIVCRGGETRAVARVRHFGQTLSRVFANIAREIDRGLIAPFVNLSYGGDPAPLMQSSAYQGMARRAQSRGVDVCWSHLSMAGGVALGRGALTVGIVAQEHEFE